VNTVVSGMVKSLVASVVPEAGVRCTVAPVTSLVVAYPITVRVKPPAPDVNPALVMTGGAAGPDSIRFTKPARTQEEEVKPLAPSA